MADCGCRIIASYNNDIGYTDNDTGFPDNVILYCPLHAAAGQMREALARAERALACSERWNTTRDCFIPAPVNVPCRRCVAKRAAREALAASEGKQ